MNPRPPRFATVQHALRSLRCSAAVPVLLVALAACGSPDEGPPPELPGAADTVPPAAPDTPATRDTPAGQPAPPTPPAPGAPPQPAPAPEPPPPAGAAWVRGVLDVKRTVTGAALLRDVRTASHEGFDRIVLDFGESGVPAYHIEYIDRPVRQCGSGEVTPLAGDAWLQIRVEPANAHTEEGQPTVRDRSRSPQLPNLRDLKMVCDFEAQVEWVGGVLTPARFRAFVLRSPDRLVVDVQTR